MVEQQTLKTEWLKTWIKIRRRDDLKCVNSFSLDDFVPNLDYSASSQVHLASQQKATWLTITGNTGKWNNEVEYYTKIKTRNETLIWLFLFFVLCLMCVQELLGRKTCKSYLLEWKGLMQMFKCLMLFNVV